MATDNPNLTAVPKSLEGLIYDPADVLEAASAALNELQPSVVSGVQQILMMVEIRLREEQQD